MHHPIDRITHTTAFVTLIVEQWLEREIAQWDHPMKDRSDDPSHHERTLLPRSYISLPHQKRPGEDFACITKHLKHDFPYRGSEMQLRGKSVLSWCDGSSDRSFMVGYFSFKPVSHDWCNKGRGMCYPVCGMVHIK